MTVVKTERLKQFYLQWLKPIWLIRVVKNVIWKLMWQIRWQIIRPIVRAIFPRSLINQLHIYSNGGLKLLVRRWFTPALPLVQLNFKADHQGVDVVAGLDDGLNGLTAKTLVCIHDAEAVCAIAPITYSSCDISQIYITDQNFSFPKIDIVQILNAEISGGSNLIIQNGVMLHHALYNFSHDFTSEELHGRIIIYPGTSKIRRIAIPPVKYTFDVAAVFTDACSSNYAHWLTEVLPRINIFYRKNADADIVLIIDSGLHPNIEASLSAVVGDKATIQRISVDEGAKVRTLCVVSPTAYIPFDRRPGVKNGHLHGVFSPHAIASLRTHLYSTLKKNSESAPPSKVFLRRNSHSRLMTNERSLEKVLASLGFAVIEPERLSFAEQFSLFSSASIIVGATGAALANLIFCTKKARIVICLSTHPDHSFGYWQDMAAAAGNQVVYVLGPLVSSNAQGIHANFSININDVLKAIEN